MAAAVRFLVGSFTIFVATFLFSSYQLTAYVFYSWIELASNIVNKLT